MRLSCDRNDPGYHPAATKVRVYLNGAERTKVITADEEARLIVRFQTDEKGRLIKNEKRDDVLRETLYGDVRIELPDNHPLLRKRKP